MWSSSRRRPEGLLWNLTLPKAMSPPGRPARLTDEQWRTFGRTPVIGSISTGAHLGHLLRSSGVGYNPDALSVRGDTRTALHRWPCGLDPHHFIVDGVKLTASCALRAQGHGAAERSTPPLGMTPDPFVARTNTWGISRVASRSILRTLPGRMRM